MALAKENSMELTKESAKAYYEVIHPKVGELADEELDNVSGSYYKGNPLVVTIEHYCTGFICKKCGTLLLSNNQNFDRNKRSAARNFHESMTALYLWVSISLHLADTETSL